MSICGGCQQPGQLIGLVCDHLLCTDCAEKTKQVQGQSTIENKYKIICPQCKRSTLTYDINNLLVNKESPSQSNFLFDHLESSEINESSLAEDRQVRKAGYATFKEFSHRDLKQMSYSQRFNNLTTQRKQSKTPEIPFDRKQNRSKLSHDSGRQNNSKGKSTPPTQQYSTKCRDHNQNLMFFCQTQKRLLCIECMYKHTRDFKAHKVVSIKNSMETIVRENAYYKDETKHRLEYLDECLKTCQSNKTMVDQMFEQAVEGVGEEFASLYNWVKVREAALKETLRAMYTEKEREISTHLADVSYIKNCLKQYYNFTFQGPSSEIYFFNSYTLMRDAMSKMNFNFKPIDKQSLNVLQKGLALDDVKAMIERYIHVKKQRKSQSRTSDAQHGDKSKAALTDQIKNAKKKLEKLEKMEKQEKSNNYLNNYLINLKRDDHSEARDRKNSAIELQAKKHKPVTPTRVSSKLKAKR